MKIWTVLGEPWATTSDTLCYNYGEFKSQEEALAEIERLRVLMENEKMESQRLYVYNGRFF